MQKETLYLVKTDQGKLLKALKRQGLVADVTELKGTTTHKAHRRGRPPGRPPKA